MKLQYINLHSELYYAVDAMRDNGERGQLFMAILQVANGIEPDELPANVKPIFAMIRAQMEEGAAKSNARANVLRENGKKGGRPKKTQNQENQIGLDENQENQIGFQKSIKENKIKKEVEEKNNSGFSETSASAAFEIPDDELAKLREENERIDAIIRSYRFPDTDLTRGELLQDAEKYGHKAQDVALEAANKSNSRQGMSLNFYRKFLNAGGDDNDGRKRASGTWGVMF